MSAFFWFTTFIAALFSTQAAAAPRVVASIKPIHSLVSMVMAGSGSEPVLLVAGGQSIHGVSLKPSQADSLKKADLIFYIDPHMELFLSPLLDATPNSAKTIALAKQKNIKLLPLRLGHGFAPHHHGDDNDNDQATPDLHIWSSPANGRAMLEAIAAELSRIDPAQQSLYEKNRDQALAELDALDAAIKKRMAKLSDKRFISFHDASQYFEQYYGLQSVGSITLNPERGTGAKHLSALHKTIAAQNVACVFHEPQFEGRVIENLLAGTNVRSTLLDPEAALIPSSDKLYFELLERLAASFEICLR